MTLTRYEKIYPRNNYLWLMMGKGDPVKRTKGEIKIGKKKKICKCSILRSFSKKLSKNNERFFLSTKATSLLEGTSR